MNKDGKLLTIGQFAALHGINKKTLMWYDEIGLFKPSSINPENGYRCYDYHQSPVLETILLLRELDVSVSEIQTFMQNRSAAALKSLLDEKITDLDRSIMHLQAIRQTLYSHHQDMVTLLTMNLSEINIVEKEERYLVTVDIDENTSFEQEVEMIVSKTTEYHLGRLHDASYGSMIPVENLQKSHFNDYTNLFIEIPFLKPDSAPLKTPLNGSGQTEDIISYQNGLHIQPGGKYIRAFHKGDWSGIPCRYQAIFNYADSHGLTLSGFSYEKGINETVIDRIEDYIVQIEIPISV